MSTAYIGLIHLIIGLILLAVASHFNSDILSVISYIAGTLLAIAGGYFIRNGNKKENLMKSNDYKLKKQAFIANAHKIKVDLLQCKVQHYDYVNERAYTYWEHKSPFVDTRNEWSGDMICDEILRAVVSYKVDLNGTIHEFHSHTIAKDKETLLFLLGHPKRNLSVY